MKYFVGISYDPEKEALEEATAKLKSLCFEYGVEASEIKKEEHKKPDGSVYYTLTTNSK